MKKNQLFLFLLFLFLAVPLTYATYIEGIGLPIGDERLLTDLISPLNDEQIKELWEAPPYIPQEVIVNYGDMSKLNIQKFNQLKNRFGLTTLHRYERRNIELVHIGKRNISVEQVISALKQVGVQNAEPNYIVWTFEIPNDNRYIHQYGLRQINAPQAWEISTGGNVVVAVVDTGAQWNHEDLEPNNWINSKEDINKNGKFDPGDLNKRDDDGNGYIDDVIGYDFVKDDPDVYDGPYSDLHATGTGGIIGAVGNNNIGIAGVMWKVKIMRCKMIDGMSGGLYPAIAAIDYAVDNHAQVINASWGSFGGATEIEQAIARAAKAGIPFVAAAGNFHVNNDRFPVYPASYNLPNVIAVAATDQLGTFASLYSDYGVESVDLAAPGTRVLTTYPGNTYLALSGTSFAAPHVSGAAALLLTIDPTLTPTEIKTIFMNTVTPERTLEDKVASGGILNLAGAVKCVKNRSFCN